MARADQILPIVLHLLIAFVKESAKIDENCVVPDLPPGHLTVVAAAALQVLTILLYCTKSIVGNEKARQLISIRFYENSLADAAD